MNKIESFKNKANNKYGQKYDYNKVNFSKQKDLITVICRSHGEYVTTPYSHLYTKTSGQCLKCTQEQKNLDFIEKSNITHNNYYNYSKVVFTREIDNVIIICPQHGEFNQIARDHSTRGTKCPKCSSIYRGRKTRVSKEEYIRRCNKIHNNFYDYSLIKFEKITQTEREIEIICPIHGNFVQRLDDHLYNKSGCSKCYGNYNYTSDEFIEKARIQFPEYSFNKVSYVNMYTKIMVTCNNHGDFEKIPSSLLHQNSGCPKCRVTNGERSILNYLNNTGIDFQFQYKNHNCINPLTNYKLIFDFYIPSKNLIIEFDGIQHFENTHGELEEIQFRDNIKNNWCKENNIQLIRISYKDLKNINTMLDELKILH